MESGSTDDQTFIKSSEGIGIWSLWNSGDIKLLDGDILQGDQSKTNTPV